MAYKSKFQESSSYFAIETPTEGFTGAGYSPFGEGRIEFTNGRIEIYSSGTDQESHQSRFSEEKAHQLYMVMKEYFEPTN